MCCDRPDSVMRTASQSSRPVVPFEYIKHHILVLHRLHQSATLTICHQKLFCLNPSCLGRLIYLFQLAKTGRRRCYGSCNVDALNEAIYKVCGCCKEECSAWIYQNHVDNVSNKFYKENTTLIKTPNTLAIDSAADESDIEVCVQTFT
jgi:hypothetical protein